MQVKIFSNHRLILKVCTNIVFVVLVITFSSMLLAKNGLLSGIRNLEQTNLNQAKQIKTMQARNLLAYQEVLWLKQYPEAIIESARNDLGLVTKNETYYQIVEAEN